MKKEYWVIQPDEDSGFQDDCASVAYGEDRSYPVEITAYKTSSWNCCASTKKNDGKPKDQEEKFQEKNRLPEKTTRKGNFLQRATKKIIGKTKRIFENLKPEEDKKAAPVNSETTPLKESLTNQVINIILPATSSTSINEDLVDDGKDKFFRADPLRSPFRDSRSSASSRESRESYRHTESLNSFQRTDPLRCSIRGPRDSFFRESRRGGHPRVGERQTMLRVLFDFQACDDDDISVRRGELVKVLNKEDDDWWWVENVYRERGFVPRNFLWPCGCYVCQKFILDRVTNVGPPPKYQVMEQERNQFTSEFYGSDYPRFDEKTKLVGNRKCTSTWC